MELSKSQAMLGESPLMLDLMDRISRVAALDKPILVLGERGTGKELVAERLHFLSRRWDKPFLKINCAAIHENLLESELFGHEAGAFTGAARRHKGRFERSETGTLFLDELATCSIQVQEKLLRIVEYGEFERLGGHETLNADVRLIAATNADVKAMAGAGEFRADLLDRLAFDVIHIPPLRYRQQDVVILAEYFALSMCRELERPFFPGFSPRALEQLQDYGWPGNVRELKNAVERSIYQQEDTDNLLEDLIIDPFIVPWKKSEQESTYPVSQPAQILLSNKECAGDKVAALDEPLQAEGRQAQAGALQAGGGVSIGDQGKGLEQQVELLEQKLLVQALKNNQFNQKLTAEKLKLTYHQLRSLLRKHKMIPIKKYFKQQDGYQERV